MIPKPEMTAIALALLLRSTNVELRGEQFVDKKLGACWDALCSLQHDQIPLGLSELAERAKLTADEMVQIAEASSFPATCKLGLDDFNAVARSISDAWLDREVRDVVCMALRAKQGGRDLLLDLLQHLRRFDTGWGSEVISIERYVEQIWGEAVEARDHPDKVKPRGVPTGIQSVDDKLAFRGVARGQITAIGGATSAGKSAFSNTLIRGASKAGLATLVVPLEDNPASVTTRLLANISRLQNRALQRREVGGAGEWERFGQAASEVAGWRVRFMPLAVPAPALSQAIRSYCLREETDLCVIDYLQRISPGKATKSAQERIDFALEQIEDARVALPGVAFILVSQLVRRKDDSMPVKEDLYHSGAIEQWSNTIMLLWRPQFAEGSCIAVNVDKQKDGPTGLITLRWDPEHQCYSEPEEWERKAFEAQIERSR